MPILCATDFSPSSRAAVQVAAALARRLQRTLLLVHATEPPPIALPEATVGIEAWEAAIQEAAEVELDNLARAIRADGVKVEAVVSVGGPIGVIQQLATDKGATLLVIGTHGRKGATRFFLGSVAERIVRSAHVPVLVVPEGATVPDWRAQATWRLLVVGDGSAASQGAWSWSAGLPERLGAGIAPTLSFLRLFWPHQEAQRYGLDLDWHPGEGPSTMVPLLERDMRHELAALGLPSETPLALRAAGRDPAHDVCVEALAQKVDALIMGVGRGRNPLGGALRPGALLRASAVPVLCVPLTAAPVEDHLAPVKVALVATDLSDDSREALRTAYRLMRGQGQRVELCHVVLRGPAGDGIDVPFAPSLSATERATIEDRLRALVPKEAAALGITTHVAALEGNGAAEALLQAAARLEADLIVLAFHGRTGASRLIHGSVSEEIARRSPKPVVLVHPR